jgi:two-component system sensor histidine kinase and response regulator WspE
LQLTSGTVDVLLACVDLLETLAEAAGEGLAAWLADHHREVAGLAERLDRAVREGGQAQPADQDAAPPPGGGPVAAGPSTSAVATVAPAAEDFPGGAAGARAAEDVRKGSADASARGSAPASPAATLDSTAGPRPTSQAGAADESVVRVTARSLTRLLGLAGESLVESRWLQPFSKSLLHLKQLHAQLAETIEGLGEGIQSENAKERCAVLLAEVRGRLAACRELLSDRIGEFDRRTRDADDLSARLYREVISSRMRPFGDGVQGLPRLVRDLARQLGKKVELDIQGETTEVDRDILERLDAPLNHLVRNALDHGLETPAQRQAAGKPETGRLRIEAAHSAGLLSITVADDGRGIDLERLRRKIVERGLARDDLAAKLTEGELLEFLFLPGFSTAPGVTEISGRGVGLDVVHTMVQSVGGHIRVRAEPGRGASFQMQLPVTLSVLRAVVVRIAGEPYAFPHNRIDRVIRAPRSELHALENRQYFEVDGQNVGIVMARQVLQLEGPEEPGEDLLIVLFGERSLRCGVVVDALLGEQDLVVRPLDPRFGKVPNLHAAAILDDGAPVLIVDPDDLRRSIEKLLQGGRLQRAAASAAPAEERRQRRVLVVDDSITVREVERQLLANRGYLVEAAVDGMEGWNLVREGRFDLVVCDIDMPRLNGLELVRRIKADSRLQHLPVIIVSYKDRDEDRLLGLEAGANYYLTKSSFHDDTLIQAVRELIGNAEP